MTNALLLQDQREELLFAVLNNDAGSIEVALRTPAATVLNKKGQTVLMQAVGFGSSASAQSVGLLLSGSDARAQDSNGLTPLMFALYAERFNHAALLLPLSDARARDKRGTTALMVAARMGATEIVRALIAEGDPKATDDKGWSALMFAASSGRPACIEALLSVSDPIARGVQRETALSLATAAGHAECADRLAAHSDRKQANQAMKKFGVEKMPRWALRLEAETLRKTIARKEGSSAAAPLAATAAGDAAPTPRAPSKRL